MKNSILKKWRSICLKIVLIPLLLTLVIVLISMLYLNKKNKTILINQSIDASKSYVEAKSDTINEQLSYIKRQLSVLQLNAEYLYAHKADMKTPDIKKADEFTLDESGDHIQWGPFSQQLDTEEIKQEAKLLANMESVFSAAKKTYGTITSMYIATKSGINIGYDSNYAEKAKLGYYNPTDSEWYKTPMQDEKLYISDTYSDVFGRGLTITLSMPFSVDGQTYGVVGIDVIIDSINNDILKTYFGVDGGYAMLFSDKGEIISAKGLTEENKEPKEFLGDNSSEILKGLKSKELQVNESRIGDKKCYLVSNTIETTEWKLIVVLPENQLTLPARGATRIIIYVIIILLAVYILTVGTVIVVTTRKCQKMTYPIEHLTDMVKKLGDGQLDYTNDIHSDDEIQVLSESFEAMTNDLKNYITNLASVTAEKERIGAELNIATQIQADMLPKIFPYMPERKEFDLYATMTPAKEVGGDFYDYFMVDDDHLAVVIGDVSGKGVPAALFMVISKTLIRNHVQHGDDVAKSFTDANNELSEGNTAELFTTAWLGVYEISTGKMVFADAGHETPLKKKADGTVEYVKPEKKRLMLAGIEGTQYAVNETTLLPGEMLLLYTDGVPEATDANTQMYGMERLDKVVESYKGTDPESLLEMISKEVDEFVGDAPQFDDLTMLALVINECS